MGTIGYLYPFFAFAAFRLGYGVSDTRPGGDTRRAAVASWIITLAPVPMIFAVAGIFVALDLRENPWMPALGFLTCGLWVAACAGRHYKMGRRKRFLCAMIVTCIFAFFAVALASASVYRTLMYGW